jgi:hypothetical protein
MDEERLQLEAQWAQLAGVTKWKRLLGAEDRPAWLGPEQITTNTSDRLQATANSSSASVSADLSADGMQQQSHQQQQDEDAPLRARTKRRVFIHTIC